MNDRENLISLCRRNGYTHAPKEFYLSPNKNEEYKKIYGDSVGYNERFSFPWRGVWGLDVDTLTQEERSKKFKESVNEHSRFDLFGVAYEDGDESAYHMKRMVCPMRNFDSLQQFQDYDYPVINTTSSINKMKIQIKNIHKQGLASYGGLQQTIFETAWSMRSMEELMIDFMTDSVSAEFLLDKITEFACTKMKVFAEAGVDMVMLGDDIGMQESIMMSEEIYRHWLKPRLAKVIDIGKSINPNLIVHYHSDGFMKPFIDDLIEIGVDVLNPVQPECMEFKEIYEEFGNKLSFMGTLGVQSTMPFGTPEDIKKVVFSNLEIVGDKGGLFCIPAHMIEPEVSWRNIDAYINAIDEFNKVNFGIDIPVYNKDFDRTN